jgi:hypothetical protein
LRDLLGRHRPHLHGPFDLGAAADRVARHEERVAVRDHAAAERVGP